MHKLKNFDWIHFRNVKAVISIINGKSLTYHSLNFTWNNRDFSLTYKLYIFVRIYRYADRIFHQGSFRSWRTYLSMRLMMRRLGSLVDLQQQPEIVSQFFVVSH